MRLRYCLLGFGLLSLLFSAGPSEAVSPVSLGNVPADTIRVAPSIYQQQCTFCHQAKPMTALPDLAAWTRLIYTTGCPDVRIKLADTERKALKAYIEQLLKTP